MSSKRRLGNLRSRLSIAARSVSPAWIVTAVLLLYILQSRCPLPMEDNETVGEEAHALARLHSSSTKDTVSRRLYATNNTRTSGEIGNKFCILQPTLSAGKRTWTSKDAREHIALRAFMRTFVATVTPAERVNFEFAIYYGHDSDDKVFGNPRLRAEFVKKGREMLDAAGFDESNVKMLFSPMYGLHGRINAIWNFLAKDAYYDGCDYFFLSNDDMVFFTPGWVTRATDSLAGVGSRHPHKRPCKYLGIVRFKDEWASWATFTFHVSTRLHMEIFGGVYYPVPYYAAHNDYWIHYVYRGFDASKYRGEVKVRNRVDNVDYALAHQKDKKRIAPARYTYDKLGDVRKYINEGRARLAHWIAKNKGTEFCLPPL